MEGKLFLVYVNGPATLCIGKASNFLLPAFNRRDIRRSRELGILSAGMGVGALLGSLLLASLSDFKRKGKLMLGTAYGWALAILTFALLGSNNGYSFGAVGIFGSIFGALNMSLIQLKAPQYIRGRVMVTYCNSGLCLSV